jgi:outer membrane protein OmpA-like peptidoglycan-associated protein
MKKLLLAGVAATLLSTNSFASQCASENDRIGFALIGAAQGAAIGGPAGAIWGLGTVWYSQWFKNPSDCSNEVQTSLYAMDQKIDSMKSSSDSTNLNGESLLKSIPSFVNFAYDSYKVQSTNVDIATIKQDHIERVQVDGHTDQKGTNEYNFALGLKRANAVKQVLIQNNFDETKIKTTSYGESSPISNDDAKNRRVDLTIYYTK